LYPFKVVDEDSVSQLPGYEDRNIYFKGYFELSDGTVKSKITTSTTQYDEFIFKVSHITNSYEVLQGVNEAMDHLKSKSFHCSYAIVNRSGEKITLLSENQLLRGDPNVRSGRGATQYPVRVLKYIPGTVLHTVQRTPKLAYGIGELAGSIDKALLVRLRPLQYYDSLFPLSSESLGYAGGWFIIHYSIRIRAPATLTIHAKATRTL
jgi:hypothetical protein